MGWMTVGSVDTSHLNSQEEIDWIETHGEEFLERFIEIMEGDASRQYSVDVNDVRTLSEIVEAIKSGDIYRVTVNEDYSVAVDALRLLASEETRGYWSSDIDFSFEAN